MFPSVISNLGHQLYYDVVYCGCEELARFEIVDKHEIMVDGDLRRQSKLWSSKAARQQGGNMSPKQA